MYIVTLSIYIYTFPLSICTLCINNYAVSLSIQAGRPDSVSKRATDRSTTCWELIHGDSVKDQPLCARQTQTAQASV